MMTDQEIFDKVLFAMRAQRGPSRNIMSCAYRGHGGRACAIGCLIPNKLYDPAIECVSIGGMETVLKEEKLHPEYYANADCGNSPKRAHVLEDVLLKCGFQRSQFGLLRNLQTLHDQYIQEDNLKAYEVEMYKLADAYKLVYLIPDRADEIPKMWDM